MTNIQEEIWKDITDYEGYYQVSNFGRVRSLDRVVNGRLMKGIILAPVTFKLTRYLNVSLSKHNKYKPNSIHRIVAKAFIPNPENKPQVNHKNAIRNDNRVENLEWVTGSENQKHAFRIGSHKPTTGELHGMCKISEDTAIKILKSKDDPKILASRFKVSIATIYDIQKRRSWRHLVLGLLLILISLSSQAQVTIPSVYVDSILYEVSKGRACNDLQQAQASEIKALGIELVANAKAIKLQQSENTTLQFIIDSLQKELVLNGQAHTLEKKWLKSLVLKLKLVVIGEALLIVLILL